MKRIISLIMALLLLTLSLAACGSEDKKASEDSAHDPALVGYWISEKQVASDGTTTEEKDVAGEIGLEFYENGMVRIMKRGIDEDGNVCFYTVNEKYYDYMIINGNQLAYLKKTSSGEDYIALILEYSVKDGVLTLVHYGPGSKSGVSYKRLDTPFYKYFPEAPAQNAGGGLGDIIDAIIPDEG